MKLVKINCSSVWAWTAKPWKPSTLQVNLFLNTRNHREVLCENRQTMQGLLCMNNGNHTRVYVYEQWKPHKNFCVWTMETTQEILCMNNGNHTRVTVYEQWKPHKNFCVWTMETKQEIVCVCVCVCVCVTSHCNLTTVSNRSVNGGNIIRQWTCS